MDDYYFWFFDFDDKVRVYEHTLPFYATWAGLSGFGVDLTESTKIPFFKELLMYPMLVFVSFVVVFFTPARLLYTFLELISFNSSLTDYTIDNWNTFLSFFDAFYMVFLSPFDIFVRLLVLLPIDIVWYLSQLFSWIGVNIPIFLYYIAYGWEIMFNRLYYYSMYIIFHFLEFKENTGLVIIWYYFFWWAMVMWWQLNYLFMTFGGNYWYYYNDVGY
jgi:hypothetical protein